MTKQWEKFRQIIIAEYKEQNKPLHEVQRVMKEKYGFRASTRAYRSRFDRWGIHKYSRRRRTRSMSIGKRDSVSDGAVPASPQQSLYVEEMDSRPASPVDTPHGLVGPPICVAAPGMSHPRPMCLVKTDHQYAPATQSASLAVAQNPVLPLDPFGAGYVTFGSQAIGCYSPNAIPVYRQVTRDAGLVTSGTADPSQKNSSMAGLPPGYEYSLAVLAGH